MPADPPTPHVHPLSREAWRQWLLQHHQTENGVWLVFYKTATGQPRVTYDDAVEEALCVGWVDSRPRKLDAQRSLLWFSPRQAGSGWSRPNKLRVERLLAAGLITPAGLQKIKQAQADGAWSRLDAVEDLLVPPDLAQALAALPGATAHFAAFPRSVRRGILEWIVNARTAPTRSQRVHTTAEMASRNERANQWRPKA